MKTLTSLWQIRIVVSCIAFVPAVVSACIAFAVQKWSWAFIASGLGAAGICLFLQPFFRSPSSLLSVDEWRSLGVGSGSLRIALVIIAASFMVAGTIAGVIGR